MTDAERVESKALHDRLRVIADTEVEAFPGTDLFMGWPDRWWSSRLWRCLNGHVSSRILKSEALGRDACLAAGCHHSPVHLTFPEDVDGPLEEPTWPA